jgi:hypothetical protein
MSIPTFILKISVAGKTTRYIQDGLQEYCDETGNSFETLENLTDISFDEVKKLNGKHPIFGTIECFEQSGKRPTWYSRKTAKYSWNAIDN